MRLPIWNTTESFSWSPKNETVTGSTVTVLSSRKTRSSSSKKNYFPLMSKLPKNKKNWRPRRPELNSMRELLLVSKPGVIPLLRACSQPQSLAPSQTPRARAEKLSKNRSLRRRSRDCGKRTLSENRVFRASGRTPCSNWSSSRWLSVKRFSRLYSTF